MREIKFRGKDLRTGEWKYGYYVGYSQAMGYIHGDYVDKDEVWQVDANTVGQYIGFKDDNNIEIYEGDIIDCFGGEYYHGIWEYSSREVIDNINNLHNLAFASAQIIEISGNIYENNEG